MQNINSKFDIELKKSINKFLDDLLSIQLCKSCEYKNKCPSDGFDTSTEYYKKCLKLKDALKYFKKRFRKVIYLWWE